jgi:hypothetical protein
MKKTSTTFYKMKKWHQAKSLMKKKQVRRGENSGGNDKRST